MRIGSFGLVFILLLTACSKLEYKRFDRLQHKKPYRIISSEDYLKIDFFDFPMPYSMNYYNDQDSIVQRKKYRVGASIYPTSYKLHCKLKSYSENPERQNYPCKSFLSITATTNVGTSSSQCHNCGFSFMYLPKVDTFEILAKNKVRDEMTWGKDAKAIFNHSMVSRPTLKDWFSTDTAFSPISHLQFRNFAPFLSEWKVEIKKDYPSNKKLADSLIYKYRYKDEKFPDSLTYPDTSVVFMGVNLYINNKCEDSMKAKPELKTKPGISDGIINLNPETYEYETSIRSLWYIYIQDIIYGPLSSCYYYHYRENNLYQLKRKYKRYIRQSFRKDELDYHASFFKLALYKLYRPNSLDLKSRRGSEAIFTFKSTNPSYPGNYEVKFNIYEPYRFKVFKR